MNKGKTIFAQIMSLINEYEFNFAQFTDRAGLRDIETTLNLCGDLYRSGIKVMPRSTLAEANEKKDWRIYQDFAMTLVGEATALYKDEKLRIGLEEMIYAFDSSTIELCLKLCPWAEFHHGKGAFKMHTLLDLRGSIPTFVMLTPGKVNDAKVMDKIPVEAGTFYLMDKGYVAFETYFVTRAKDNMSYEVIKSRPVNKDSGVLSDETIRLTGYYSTRKFPDTLRLVVYEDFESGKVYRFLTNNFDPLTIAELYRERWQIELFFKWIKQHLHIKTFYGTSQNAVYTQIWIAVCDYLLLIIAKKRYGLVPSLHSISNSIGQVLFQRTDIRDLFNQPTVPVSVPETFNQPTVPVSVPETGSVVQLTLW